MALFVSVFMKDSVEYSGNNSDPRDALWLKRRSCVCKEKKCR